jgi:apolipoprotein D and lipocalin family protein
VELNRYLGKWYEMARYDMMFERGCEGVTAEYSLRPDGLIKVVNSCHKGAVDGPLSVAVGRARRMGDPLNARLQVSFFGPFFADYWVLDHGPEYEWSIVGEGSGRYLWILTRDPVPSAALREELLGRVKAMGYDLSLLRTTQQK